MSDLILHHYWPSPVAEKVRIFLGFKGLDWQSVEIPRVPPKPDVIALTGGYRRTPLLQIGADIYCDSQCIIREIDKRFPTPGRDKNAPLESELNWGITRWTDGELFTHVIRVVLGSQVDTLDKVFLADRARLYFGPDWTAASIRDGVQHSISQVMTGFSWMDNALSTGNNYLNGDTPGIVDACCFHICWFIRGRFEGGAAMLGAFPHLSEWEERIKEIGGGNHSDLSSTVALDISRISTPQTLDNTEPERKVAVVPATDGGDPEVEGQLVHLSTNEIVLRRSDPRAGEVHVHFPRMGYLLIDR